MRRPCFRMGILASPLLSRRNKLFYTAHYLRYTMSIKMMQRYGSVALAALALGAICLPPAEAAYKPKITSKMDEQAVKDVQKAVAMLKAMPQPLRWTFMGVKLGLLFMPPNGRIGLDDGYMMIGSHFIGVDGMEYDARTEYKAQASHDDWIYCAKLLDRHGREILFSKLSSEVTAFVQENAKYHLEKLAEEIPGMRDLYLAFIAKLCYLPDGNSPYDKLSTGIGPHKQPVQTYEIGDKGCKFVDTEGNELSYDDLRRKYKAVGGNRWFLLNVCVHHVGEKDILALFPEEVKKMRANYEKKMQELKR